MTYKLRPVYHCSYKDRYGKEGREGKINQYGESSLKKTPSFWMLLKDGKLVDTFLRKATFRNRYPHIKLEII